MSRNFDLMQEITFSPEATAKTAIAAERAAGNTEPKLRSDSDGTLDLVQRIFLLQSQEPPRLVVFAGIDHGNGCSHIASSVAETLAGNAYGSVCLVEANFRSPGLPDVFGTTNHHGLTNALLEDGAIRSFVKPVRDDSLWLLSSGSLAVDSPRLLSSERLKARTEELRKEFDFVIVDAPPISRYADAITLGQLSDGVVLILEAEATHREAARAAVESLRSSNVPILGAVLNKRVFPIPEKIYNRL